MKLRETFLRVTGADIAEFESRLGTRLPEDYREFLLASNGGYLDGNYRFEISSEEGGSILNEFYRLKDKAHSTSTLDYIARLYVDRLPAALISIGGDAGAGQICLRVRGPGFGSVYYWDPATDFDDTVKGSFGNIHEIAASFSNFVEHLKLVA